MIKSRFHKYLTSCCLILVASSSFANPVNWTGEWIWTETNGIPNTWVALRKDVTLDVIGDKAIANLAADTKYWLWINGELVVFEGGYTGGPSPVKSSPRVDYFPIASNKYYDTVDIRPYLRRGKNTIAALAWYYGSNGDKGTHISSGKGGFIFQAEIGDLTVVSDASWKSRQHEAYDPDVKKLPPYRIAAFSVKYDARKDLGDWSDDAWYLPGYDDSDWEPAKSNRQPPAAPFFELYASEIPILKNYGLANCTNYPDSKFPLISDGEKILCQLDFNKNYTPYFDIEAEAGLDVHIDSNMSRNTIETFYTTRAGRQQFESYSWANGRVIEYTFPNGVIVHGLKYRWTGVGETPGNFEASDAWYQRIWQMAENTLYICARDNFMDTPDRERGLWIGDVADQASYLFYSMDQPGRDLLKKAIRVTLAFSDSESGIFAGLGPGRFRELPAQSLQFIDQGIWHYYFNTGDLDTLKFAYPYVHKYLSIWNIKESGLVEFRGGAWRWTDWGPQDTIDYEPIQNALYYNALIAARNMAKAIGDDTHRSFYDSRIAAIRQAYQENYWKDGFYSSDPAQFKDDRTNALAILVGLADESKFQPIVDNVLVPNHFASPHFEWMVYDAMAIAGRYEDSLRRMKTRYDEQVSDATRSTLSEYLTGYSAGRGTENHAWNAPSTILSKHIAGVAPTSVAWKTYRVFPNMVHMTRIKQVAPSVQGTINVEMTRTQSEFTMDLQSPEGTQATIGIPKQYFDVRSIGVNNRRIWHDGILDSKLSGMTWAGEDDDYYMFHVSAGSWAIKATDK